MDDSKTPETPGARCCRKCGKTKPETEFYVKSKKTGLLMLDCKPCVCADRKAYLLENPDRRSHLKPEIRERRLADFRRRYWDDPEKYRASGRNSYQKRKSMARAKAKERYYENQEKEIARSLAWNKANPEKVMAWRMANPDKLREATKRYAQKHPERATISRGARRALMLNAKVDRIKPGIDTRLMVWQRGLCPYCRADLNVVPRHRDHVISLARGGSHAELNLQLTCKPCNLRKHAKHPLDFAAEMGIVKNPTLIPI